MGNYRFRLSDMMPNAWFYKLKEMGRTRNRNTTIHSMKKKQPTTTSSAPTTAQPSKPKQPHFSHPRKSYYFTRDPIPTDKFFNSPTNPKVSDDSLFPDPPRKSSKKQQTNRKKPTRPSSKLVTSSVAAGCSCSEWSKSNRLPEYSVSPLDSSPEPEFHEPLRPETRSARALSGESFDGMVSFSRSCTCRVNSNAKDIVIDMDEMSFTRKFEKLDGFERITGLELPPIITKPPKFNDMVREIKEKETKEAVKHRKSSAKFEETNGHGALSVKILEESTTTTTTLKEQRTSPAKRFSANSPGMRLRVNSPKIASRKILAHGRKSVSSSSSSSSRRSISDSLAIVKASCNPQRDFRDSMVEMIVENNIRASKDLEELLACYLSLNSDEYHDLIIKVFKQIWFDLTDIRMK
ncbi:hypothetical protein L1049_009349 [Liquidambar formosana]|uniref:Transcription repressor n=1 Tax=Liquidambar formosana TaxID=63359 RepID=A0AAP0X531_LIQFO